MENPNYYWYGYLGGKEVDRAEGENTLYWIMRFEQERRPGHFFEIWVDANSSDVVGGEAS